MAGSGGPGSRVLGHVDSDLSHATGVVGVNKAADEQVSVRCVDFASKSSCVVALHQVDSSDLHDYACTPCVH